MWYIIGLVVLYFFLKPAKKREITKDDIERFKYRNGL